MNLKTVLPFTILILSTNYLCGWTYDGGRERRQIYNDSIVVAASHHYGKMNPFKYLFMGKNYRLDWAQPVKMPVFHIATHNGGYKIEKMGGGMQTKSLHIKDQNGVGWVLRTVDKDVTNALIPEVRNTFLKSIVQDQISASYPYAPLTITDLALNMGIPTDTAQLFFVPDDPALGDYRPYFANTVCFLRRKNLTADQSDTYDTQEIKKKLFSSATFQVMQEQVLRARLLDMMIGDWDRHDKQWDWGVRDSMEMHYIYPIPEDRDQAYFLAEGLLPKIIRMVALPHLVGFKPTLRTVKDLNNKAYGFDHFFLSGLQAADWRRIIREVRGALSEDLIRETIGKLPPEVYTLSGEELANKLIKRRNELERYGMDYYLFIAWEAIIPLTKEQEVIHITALPQKATHITVESADGKIWFQRTFLKKETRSIRFLNYGKEDVVIKEGKAANSSIKIMYDKRSADTLALAR